MIKALDRFDIFQDLARDQLDAISKLCKTATVKKGERIFKAGDQARSLFLVRAGKVVLRFNAMFYNAEMEMSLDTKMEGEVFGWSAMTPPHKYTLSAYADEDSDLWHIDQADIQGLCEAETGLGYVFMKNIARTVGQRYQLARQMLVNEIQNGLKEKDPFA